MTVCDLFGSLVVGHPKSKEEKTTNREGQVVTTPPTRSTLSFLRLNLPNFLRIGSGTLNARASLQRSRTQL